MNLILSHPNLPNSHSSRSSSHSLDPNQLMLIFQNAPYHPDTLLQLSEVSAQQGDPGQALDFLNRALFGFERSLNPLFNLNKGLVRLDFALIENRGFFRAVEKSMQLLTKRGCWRTAFETCKLLFGLDPYQVSESHWASTCILSL